MNNPSEVLVRVLRVFTDENGSQGNALGVVDGALVATPDRQGVALELGFSETIFIDDRATGEIRIFTPAVELPLAGHPVVGAAWLLLNERGVETFELRPPGGIVRAWAGSDGSTWIDAPLETLPDWTLVELGSPDAIDALSGPLQADHDHVVYWARIESGVLRVRCFAPRYGVIEDQATGSAALRLAAALKEPLEIWQGNGSLLFASPLDSERASVGGFVVEDEPLHL